MTENVKLSVGTGDGVEIALTGPPRAVEELVRKLRDVGGPLSVTGGSCCWTLSRGGTTMHLVVDSEKAA